MHIAVGRLLADAMESYPFCIGATNKMSDSQIIVALLLSLIPAILAYRLGTALYQ